MPSSRDLHPSKLQPLWAGAAAFAASWVALWPCTNLYASVVRAPGGNAFVFAIFAPILFFVVFAIVFFPLIWLLGRQVHPAARVAGCLAPAAAYLATHGVPRVLALLWVAFITGSVYVEAARKAADARDRKAFFRK